MKANQPQLRGRTHELDQLLTVLAEAVEGAARTVVVTGEVGIGKTALVRDFAASAREGGARVAWASCWDMDEAPAYWPWKTAVTDLGGGPDILDAMARGESPPHVFELIGPLLRSKDPPATVVVLDDAHGADEATLSLAALVARSMHDARIVLVLALCEEDVPQGSRKARLLDALSREALRIELFGLGSSHALDYFEQLHGERPPPLLSDGIVAATQGNPLLLQQVSREMKLSGDLFRSNHSLGFKMPRGAEAITDRMARRLEPATREVLAEAAVLGRRFTPALLNKINQRQGANSDALEDATARGAVRTPDGHNSYEFVHPLLREALYEGLPNQRRAELHLRAAEALESTGSISDLAHHRFKAGLHGDPHAALDALLAAARAAEGVGSIEEATRHKARALRIASAAGIEQPDLHEADSEESNGQHVSGAHGSRSVFRLDGEFWTVTFADQTSRLKNSRGMELLARLLANANRELHALDLASQSAGLSSIDSDTGPLIDDEARARYKRRLEELEEELSEAELMNDRSRLDRASSERTFLIEELKAAAGLGGRVRRSGSASERARVSTTRSIRSALRRIAAANAPLGEHLDRAIRTGTFLAYDPDPNATPSWEL